MFKFLFIFLFLHSLVFSQTNTTTLFYNKQSNNLEKIFFIQNNNNTNCSVYYYSDTDTLKYNYFLNGVSAPPDLIYQDSIFFILSQVAGSNISYYIIFRKDFYQQNSFYCPLAFDKLNKIIAFQPQPLNLLVFASFDNVLLSSYSLDLKVPFLNYYIDDAYFQNNNFYIRWNNNVDNISDGLLQYKKGDITKYCPRP